MIAPIPSGASRSRWDCRVAHAASGGSSAREAASRSLSGPMELNTKLPKGSRFSRPSLRHAQRIGEDGERVGLGDVGDAVDLALGQQGVHQRRRRFLEARAQGADHGGGEGAVQHRAALAVQRRVDLQDHAGAAQGRMRHVVAQAHAAAGREALPVHQHGMDLGMAADADHGAAAGEVVRLQHRQAHHGRGLAHLGVAGVGVVEEGLAEGVDPDLRHACQFRHVCTLLRGHSSGVRGRKEAVLF